MNTKGIGSEYRKKLAITLQHTQGVICPSLVSQALLISTQEAGRLLSRWCRLGWVKRIKRGVYIAIPTEDLTGNASVADSWVLAHHLFSPGYIAGFNAVKHWDFSEQLFETTTFFTTKKISNRHPVMDSNMRFQLKTIVPHKFFGTQIVWRDNHKLLVSDPSKTIIDLLDDPTIVGGMRIVKDIFQEYQSSHFFNMDILVNYAEKMENKTIFKRLGFLLETLEEFHFIEKYHMHEKISAGYSLFDPTVKNVCVIRSWNLKIPKIWKKEHD